MSRAAAEEGHMLWSLGQRGRLFGGWLGEAIGETACLTNGRPAEGSIACKQQSTQGQ